MAVSVSLSLKSKGSIPIDISVDRRFFRQVVRRLDLATKKRIGRQLKVDGGKITLNAVSTVKRKQERGQPQLSLVDGYNSDTGTFASKHLFVGAGAYILTATEDSATLSMGVVADEIATILEKPDKRTVKHGKRKGQSRRPGVYDGWWGIDRETREWIDRLYAVTLQAKLLEAQQGKTGCD